MNTNNGDIVPIHERESGKSCLALKNLGDNYTYTYRDHASTYNRYLIANKTYRYVQNSPFENLNKVLLGNKVRIFSNDHM